MTIGELKEFIENLPDDCVVKFLYDGPDTCAELEVNGFHLAEDDSEIVFISKDW